MRLLSLLFVPLFLFGEIFEISHFHDLPSHVQSDTLVLLDIDDTLLVPRQMLGCDEWFQHRVKQRREEEGLSSEVALDKTLAEWEAIRHLTHMDVVEEATSAVVRALQEGGATVMGLTTQRLALEACTSQQLLGHGIDLRKTAPSENDCYFVAGRHGVLFRHGILFTAGTAKGEALFRLCDEIGYVPRRIIFINDKASHLSDVERTAVGRGVPFVGLRYSYCDERKRAFQPEVARVQFQFSSLEELLSDEEALKLVD